MLKKRLFCAGMGLVLCALGCFAPAVQAASFKVLVVMSYEETYPTTPEYKEGIGAALKNNCEIRYFHMDTKQHFEAGPEKAKEAYALYEEFQPDGVIAADDNAQSMFVVPYLKDKVKTPVMFCGVNTEAEKYGYPASNVSGILERLHIRESIALAQQIVPSIKTVGYMMKESPTASFISWQVGSESETYSAKSLPPRLPKTLDQVVAMAKELRDQCDLLFAGALQGIPDKDGTPLSEKDIFSVIVKNFGKPIIGTSAYHVRYGGLCTVIHRMQEQGEIAAKMLLKAMQGTPVSEIQITRSKYGKRMINASVVKALGLTPRPSVLRGAELVRTEE
ncbi:MAG: ABC transporter substrate-binding protein [Deltaproteobacteria bacterium]|nr:MAG: ABC transporter substrate-binding protein [Deltaproteobacteria bacterium]